MSVGVILFVVALALPPAALVFIAGFRRARLGLQAFVLRMPRSSSEPTERIVMDPNAGYRGLVRVEPVPKDHLVLWSLFLLGVAVVLGLLLFRFG